MIIAWTCLRAVATVRTDVHSVGTVWTYVHLVDTTWTLCLLSRYCVDIVDIFCWFLGVSLIYYTDNLCIEKVSHYWLTLLVICMATYMPNFGLVR